MKHIFFFLLLIFFFDEVVCGQDSVAIISGQVKIESHERIVVQRKIGMSQRLLDTVVYGDFNKSFSVGEPMMISLSLGGKTVSDVVFVTPGAHIELEFDGKYKFKGTYAGINNLLLSLDVDDYKPRISGLKAYSREYAEALVDGYWARIKRIKSSGLSQNEQNVVIGFVQFQLLQDMYMMIDLSKAFGKVFEAPVVDVDYSEPLSDIDWLPELIFAGDWFPVFQEWLFSKVQTGKIAIGSRATYLNDMALAIKNMELREVYLLEALRREELRGTVKGMDRRLEKANKIVKTEKGREKLQVCSQKLAVNAISAMEGVDLSDYGFPDEKGDTVYLSEFKGKYVFIDFWSTGCNPCIAEITYAKRLEQKLRDLPLVWVSVSLDTDAEIWKSFIKNKNMSGVQLLCTRARKHPLMQCMAVNGIPRFIILDINGKVWDACSRRPSDPILERLLLKELK